MIPPSLLLALAFSPAPPQQPSTNGASTPAESRSEESFVHAFDIGEDGARGIVWSEVQDEQPVHHFKLSLDGQSWTRQRSIRYELDLRHSSFDPLLAAPDFSESDFQASERLYLVQFWTPPIEAYRSDVRAMGGIVRSFLGGHTHVVEMNEAARAAVTQLPFVRWVGEHRPEYRLEPALLSGVNDGGLDSTTRVYVKVYERGLAQKDIVATRIADLGGEVVAQIPDGFLLQAMLSPSQLAHVASWDEVAWIDRWYPVEEDMDLVREEGGANYVESVAGFTGVGVRGEIIDDDVNDGHQDLASRPVLFHGAHSGAPGHGTSVMGILFGDGTGAPAARGLLPDGQPIFADHGFLSNRYTHTAELLQPPYEASFQSNSWGTNLTTAYTAVTSELDDILFLNDLLLTHSQSNSGTRNSREQAWAKNLVSTGGIIHHNTAILTDDEWNGGASIGHADDGRIKPDMSFWYENIHTLNGQNGYLSFGGTSATSPSVAGHFGLFFEMWHAGIFGNATGTSVFDSRPHATTARAVVINSAKAYDFSGTGHDLTRSHQGWGLPDLRRVYDARTDLFIVDESIVLTELDKATFLATVDAGTPELRVTMVYLDPAGDPASVLTRINDLSVRATSPSGATNYWGNRGLKSGNWNTTGGQSNDKDVVENIFIQNPEAGTWVIEVYADEIHEDSHVETPAIDADFALVINGS
ncbi:MAG: hypothetical protein ACI841_002141, partial [Planctomycetota bacterium]